MPKNVIMPALGVAQETGRVLRWLKAEGERITQNEPLLEIETDKATLDLEASASGVLRSVSAKEGDEVPVGTVIAEIWADGEMSADSTTPTVRPTEPEVSSSGGGALHNMKMESTVGMQDRSVKASSSENASQVPSPASSPRERVPSSPKARRLAAERGIDLNSLAGDGPTRTIIASDVLQRQSGEGAETQSEMEISRIWKMMANRTSEAWKTIPHFYLIREVDASKLIEWRQTLQAQSAQKITLTDVLLKNVATCLRLHPRLNSQWRNGNIQRQVEINIGLAVGLDQGIIVPVIRDADHLTVFEIAAERSRLVNLAQTETLHPEDISGGTFTISNLGMYGVDCFQAIVNPPHAAILAVGRVAQRLVPIDNQPVVRPMMTLSISCDHRLVDGVCAAKFLTALAESLEQASPSGT